MIVKFLIENGEILYIVDSDDNLELYKNDVKGESAIIAKPMYPLSEVISGFYVLDGSLTPRPNMVLEIEGNILRGVPKGSSIYIDNSSYYVDTFSPVILDFPYPGTYIIRVSPPFPYIPSEISYENNSQT